MNFQAVLLQPKKSSAKRLREVLNSVFRHLDQVAAASILDVGTRSRNSRVSTVRSASLPGRDCPGTVLGRLLWKSVFHKCGNTTRKRLRGGGVARKYGQCLESFLESTRINQETMCARGTLLSSFAGVRGDPWAAAQQPGLLSLRLLPPRPQSPWLERRAGATKLSHPCRPHRGSFPSARAV